MNMSTMNEQCNAAFEAWIAEKTSASLTLGQVFEAGWNACRFPAKTIDEVKRRVHMALEFCKARERIIDSVPDPWEDGCNITIVENVYQHPVLHVFLDRTSNSKNRTGRLLNVMTLRYHSTIIALHRMEAMTLSARDLNALVEKRLEYALTRFHEVSLYDVDNSWSCEAAQESLAIS